MGYSEKIEKIRRRLNSRVRLRATWFRKRCLTPSPKGRLTTLSLLSQKGIPRASGLVNKLIRSPPAANNLTSPGLCRAARAEPDIDSRQERSLSSFAFRYWNFRLGRGKRTSASPLAKRSEHHAAPY